MLGNWGLKLRISGKICLEFFSWGCSNVFLGIDWVFLNCCEIKLGL